MHLSTTRIMDQQPPKKEINSSERLPVSQKIAYGLGSVNDIWGNWLYPQMVWPVFNIFLHVNPILVSTALMVNRLADAVSDPVFGWISDNTRSKWGRRRPYILIGSILAGIGFPLLFMVSPDWSERSIFLYMLISSAVFITIVSCFNMPYQSLGNEMTPDYNERTSVFAYRGVIQKIGEVGLFMAAAFVTMSLFRDAATGEPDILKGARVYGLIIGGLMILVGVIVFFATKERYFEKIVELKQERLPIFDSLWNALKCRPFRAQLAMALSYGVGTSMLGSLGYYLTIYYVCSGDVALGSKWTFAMGLSNMVFGIMGVPVFAFVAKKWGKRPAMMGVQIIGIMVFIASWWLYTPLVPWLQLFASGGIAFTTGAFWMLYGSMGADVIDDDELRSGKRREGAFMSCSTYLMKIGLAIGIGCSGFVLAWTGFDAKLGALQPEHTLDRIRLLFAIVPILGLSLALFSVIRFGLTRKRMIQIRYELEQRRGTV